MNTCLTILSTLLCISANLPAQQLPLATYQEIPQYQPYIAGGPHVSVWFGERVALVIDGEKAPENRNQKVIIEILKTLDETFAAFERITGVKPILNGPFPNHTTVEVSSKVGGGLAHHNRLGIAVGDGFFEKLYQRFEQGTKTLDQVFLYEIARNYWPPTFNPRIDYHTTKGPEDYGWWTVGFNNAMSIFLPSEITSITDMHYFGQNGRQFAEGMEKNLTTFLAGDYSWEEAWCVNLMPWSQRTSLNDLMTALLIRLHRENGGNTFLKSLYREIPKLPPLKARNDYQGARDNFYLASSLAASKDLSNVFQEIRWEISDQARTALRQQLAE
ncbi:MAG: hypothetical protein AAGC74_08935 [Verrucomicrobiota bacterium]